MVNHQIAHEIATRHAKPGCSGSAGMCCCSEVNPDLWAAVGSFTRIIPERTEATLTGGANIFHASLPVHTGNASGYDWSVCPVTPP